MGSCEHLLVIDEPICSPKQLSPGGSPDEATATDNHVGQDCGEYLIQPESSVDVGLQQFRERQEEVEQSVSSSLYSQSVQHGAASESCSGSIEDFKGAICHNTVTVDKTCQDGGFAGELENSFLPELDKLFTVECGINRIFLDEIEAKHDDGAEPGSLPLENVQCSVGDGSVNYSRDSQMPSEDQLLDAGVNSFLPEDENHTSVKDTELVPEKSSISCRSQICYQVSPSQDGLELSHLDIAKVSLSDSAQRFSTKDGEAYSIEKVPESYVQNLDVLSGWRFGASETMLDNMENHVKEGYSFEASLSVDKQSLHQNLADTINYMAATSVSSIAENEDTKHARVDDICEIGSNEMVSLRRSSRKNKFIQKAPGRKYVKNNMKNGLSTVDEIIDLLPEAARRKRSCLTKSVRSIAWGLLANLLQRFEQSNGLPVNEILNQGSRKAKGGQRKKKKNNPQVKVNSHRSRGKNDVFSRPIRLKVTFGGKVTQSSTKGMPSAGADISAGVCSISADDKPSLSSQLSNRMDASGVAEMPKLLQICCASEISKKPISRQDNCVESHPSDCDLDSNFTSSKSDGIHCRISSHMEAEKSGGSNNDGYVELGTSPDSEVINQVPDSQLRAVPSDFLHDPVLAPTKTVVSSADVPKAPLSRMFKKRGHKNKKSSLAGNHRVEDDNTCFGHEHKDMTSEKCQKQPKMYTDPFSTDTFASTSSGNASSNASGSELISVELIHEDSNVSLGVDKGVESALCPRMELGIEPAESWNSKLLPARAEVQGNVLLKGSKFKGKAEKKSKLSGGASKRKDSSHSRKCNKTTYASRSVSRENDMTDHYHEVDAYVEPGDHGLDDVEKTDATKGMTSDVISSQIMVPCGVGEQTLPPRKAWVCCDDCEKWRCIPAILADVIEETNCRWTCKENQDKDFVDCSIPQEKSNAEINAELDISDDDNAYARAAYSGVKGYSRSPATVPRQAPWTLIKSNVFLHRKRRSQTMDEIMVCHCNPPAGGRLGCRGECLNRMLNIECNRHTCPCGDICSNQQFQQRKYAKLNSFQCGKKGYGLQVLEDLSQGKFVIEYVGEVLDMPTYEARQREYALKGHKHFYFMTLNGNEVIDACAKGNLGRFINHSCDPNCRTEKWMVNGEICIGLFALRDIKKGEELTFDYNYVRVFGAAAKKCHCGASHCRGYIGGDPLTDGVLVQDDSEEEFPEPLVVYENGKIDRSMESIMCMSDLSVREVEIKTDLPKQGTEKPDTGGGQEASIANEKDTINVAVSVPPVNIPEILEVIQSEDVPDHPLSASSAIEEETSTAEESKSTPPLSIQTMANPPLKGIISKSLSNPDSVERKSSAEMIESKKSHPKQRSRTKVSHASESVKNHKSSGSKILPFANKSLVQFGKPKKLPEGSANRHLEAVEEKLNDLLDVAGGIYKRKDASKGYLKLLLLTAASGDSGHGGAIQSNRDLSMILDAILKTKSRGVLVDIINKNGLQMLHNMMKQYRHDFKKIPILRKLLKVFEFLAERAILTPERINTDPPCHGVESFRQSILSLTEHEDKKVHQIARNFRDRWIPRPIRKINNMEKGERRMDFNRSSNSSRSLPSHQHWRDQGVRPSEAIDCPKQSALLGSPIEAMIPEAYSSLPGDCAPTVGRVRKRKSRWDQPAAPKAPRHRKEQMLQAGLPGNSESGSQLETGVPGFSHTNEARKAEESSSCRDSNHEQIECSSVKNEREETEEDAPPGFSSPFDGRPSSSACSTIMHMPQGIICLKCPSEVGTGVPQERFNSQLPVAYGVPLMVMEQHGTPQTEMGDQWLIAPGVPFHPFPPLPPYPRDRGDALSSPCGGAVVPHKSSENWQSQWAPSCLPDQGAPSTSDASHQDSGTPITINQNTVQQKEAYAGCYGKRFFRQQKFQHSNSRRPFWKRNGKRFKGNCYGNKAFGVSIGTVVQNQQQQQVDVNFSVNSAGNSC